MEVEATTTSQVSTQNTITTVKIETNVSSTIPMPMDQAPMKSLLNPKTPGAASSSTSPSSVSVRAKRMKRSDPAQCLDM